MSELTEKEGRDIYKEHDDEFAIYGSEEFACRMAKCLHDFIGAEHIITDYALNVWENEKVCNLPYSKEYPNKKWFVDCSKTNGWSRIGTKDLEAFLATYKGKIVAGPIHYHEGQSQGCLTTPFIGYVFQCSDFVWDYSDLVEIWFTNDSDTYYGGDTPQTIEIELLLRRPSSIDKRFNLSVGDYPGYSTD
jgi:hypothetical protein